MCKTFSVVCKTFVDHASHFLSAPSDNLVSLNFPSHALILNCCQLELHTLYTPPLFSWTTFLNFVLMLTTSLLCLCLSSDLLSSLIWSMHIKTLWSLWKSYHCLKYTLIEHTIVSVYKAEHNNHSHDNALTQRMMARWL